MSVNLRSRNRAVTKQGLNVPYVHTSIQQGGGKCVTKHMGSDMIIYTDLLQIFIDNSPNGLRGKRTTSSVEQYTSLLLNFFGKFTTIDF